jgi:hypothetical protein
MTSIIDNDGAHVDVGADLCVGPLQAQTACNAASSVDTQMEFSSAA